MNSQAESDGAVTALPQLSALADELLPLGQHGAGVSVIVRGRFVRKRKLSKGLIFGDIRLDDNELLEVMIRAQAGILDVDAIRRINWDVHLGDLVTARGDLQRKEDDGLLLLLHSISVDELWSEHHAGAFFDHTDASTEPATSVQGSLVLAPSSQAGATAKYTNMVMLDGFNACKYYFSSSGGAHCLRGASCHFWHGDPADFAVNRKRWLEKRLAQRAAASRVDGDDVDAHSKADKAQRGRLFCEWLVAALGEEKLRGGAGVVDVAGGKGDIPIQLWNRRGIPTTLIDPRPMKLNKSNRRLVDQSSAAHGRGMCVQLPCRLDDEAIARHHELFQTCSVLVGMHPDEATEAIVDAALALNKPFAVVPCCVMSRIFPDRKLPDGTPVATYETLVEYLKAKHQRIQTAFLPFAGRNQVLYLFDVADGES